MIRSMAVAVALFLGWVAFGTGLSWDETKKVMVIGILFVFTALFWSGFEQASTSLNAFARDLTDRVIFGWEMPTEFLQSVRDSGFPGSDSAGERNNGRLRRSPGHLGQGVIQD